MAGSPHYDLDDVDAAAAYESLPLTNDSSGMTSGQETPEASKGKKRVFWSLPESGEAGRSDDDGLTELRREISRALPEANGPDPDTLSLPRRPPRGVLRISGPSTPQNGLIDDSIDAGISDLHTKRQSATDAHYRASRLTEDVSRSNSPTRQSAGRRPRQAPFKHLFSSSERLDSGMTTPEELEGHDVDYVPRPRRWRTGNMTALMMARGWHSRQGSFDNSSPSSPRDSPRHSGIFDLVGSSAAAAASFGSRDVADLTRSRRPELLRSGSEETLTEKQVRPSAIRSASSSLLDLRKLMKPSAAHNNDPYIKNHVEETVSRQRFLIKLCRALMLYGAPTHRLEEFMKNAAHTLQVASQFLYVPGCMIVSFDDNTSHTTEMRLVRVAQEIDLGRLRETHDVYKEVIHDHIGAGIATERLEDIMGRKPQHGVWYRILMFGFASAFVGPFAFGARLIDLPMSFILGIILGGLQLRWANQKELYSNVFEIVIVIITSFLARWWGSLRGGDLFCFPALAQSAIALILPGYTVLCGALELQSKSIIAGSVRLVYAIIYSLFLGFALTLGTALYGAMDKTATSQTICKNPLSDNGHWIYFFVPGFTFCLMVINQAKYKQMPVMAFIAFAGYLVNYWTADRFAGNPQVSSAFGSFVIAVLANLYSRINLDELVKTLSKRVLGKNAISQKVGDTALPTPSTLEKAATNPAGWRMQLYRLLHAGRSPPGSTLPSDDDKNKTTSKKKTKVTYSLAASAMLPAIFVQVPSGLSVSGSLVQGIATSNQIVSNSTGTTLTAGDVYSGQYGNSGDMSSSIAFTVGFSVVQVAIGITVGLFMGTLFMYPFGKTGKKSRSMRGALFSF